MKRVLSRTLLKSGALRDVDEPDEGLTAGAGVLSAHRHDQPIGGGASNLFVGSHFVELLVPSHLENAVALEFIELKGGRGDGAGQSKRERPTLVADPIPLLL